MGKVVGLNGKPIKQSETDDMLGRQSLAMWLRMTFSTPVSPGLFVCVKCKASSTLGEVGITSTDSALDKEAKSIRISCPSCGALIEEKHGFKPINPLKS
jgi:transcription elongation factor Elf1